MENAADALKIAGSILLFVMALSICIFSFSQARETTDAILKYSDREYFNIANDDRFYYLSQKSDTNRYVGKETIIPAIYRFYNESYKIIFKFPPGLYYHHYLYKKDGEEINCLDLTAQSIGGSEADKEEFLKGILYGDFDDDNGYDYNLDEIVAYNKKFNIDVNYYAGGLNKYIEECLYSGYKIKESLGTYYVQDVGETNQDTLEVNKDEKRVITYTFEK